MPVSRRLPVRDIAVLLGGFLVIATVAFGLRLLPEVSPTTVALVLLLIVLATATFGRLWIATTIAVTATLTFNFFFLPPLGTLTIADAQNWIALFAFLVVAVIASNLSAAVQARAREAIARRNEVTRLFDLTRDVLLTTETTGAIEALARHVARRFELSRAAICLPSDQGWRVYQGASEDVTIWIVSGPWFASLGAGARYQFSARAAFTAAARGNVSFGPLGSLLTAGPEVAFLYGF